MNAIYRVLLSAVIYGALSFFSTLSAIAIATGGFDMKINIIASLIAFGFTFFIHIKKIADNGKYDIKTRKRRKQKDDKHILKLLV